uniref:B30.2/SPRY domain-containing protein n=1 Tax=Hucho hucho TaxID=62062 RepID=A0A4W5NPS5_9TELE
MFHSFTFGLCLDMATSSSLLSEDKLLCFICLDVFTEPVTTSCGHNFCKACISKYWDSTCVCQFCTETDHKAPNTVPLEEECGERKVKLGKTEAEMQQMIQERLQKVKEIKHSVELSKKDARREISDSVQVFTDLVRSIERSQGELIEVIEEKQKAAEQAIIELKGRSTELEQLLHTEDHLHLIQSFPSLCTPPHTQDWSEISVHSDLCVGTLMRAVFQLDETLNKEMEKLPEVKLKRMKRMQQYEVDITLDPDTAHPELILSEDEKQVRHGDTQINLPDNPERFERVVNVLGKDGFSSGRFYYEVTVKGKIEWDLGVASESINRKGPITLSPKNGYWAVEKPQKVGVFVDYEEGQVSFYDVEARSHIYSFTGCTFTEKLYPYFSPCFNDGVKNSAPLIISPVNYTD